MMQTRMKLPVWPCHRDILNVIHENQVVIISGETGCGKSTQVPQYILDNWLINRSISLEKKKSCLNIICTQPRRISAVGVAERVAAERIEHIGDTIGYHIRLERRVSSKTRVTFWTLGILLQKLMANNTLSGVTHVIVDEVHERNADSDFLLMLLKDLISKKHTLKVILMSATIKADTFSSYFGNAPVIHIPGKTFPVQQIFLEDLFEKTEFAFTRDSRFIDKYRYKKVDEQLNKALTEENIIAVKLSYNIEEETAGDDTLSLEKLICRYPGYTKLTYKNLFVMNHEKVNFDLIEKTLEWIIYGGHNCTRWGSILVFLPGINEISAMMEQLLKNRYFSDTKQFVIVPLHSSLSNEEQNRIFMTALDICKIVLSTNLVETSITIEDCVYVIDTGMMKEVQFNPVRDMESLQICWASRTNIMQRKGRAGRVMPGMCIHLYTSHRFKNLLDEDPTPEVLRISLEQLVLRIYLMHEGKQMDLNKIFEKMIDSPTNLDITSAKQRLQNTGALDTKYILTPLGHHLAKLPVNVRIGKLILFGAIFCCLDSALTIEACLSHKTPFNVPLEKRGKIRNPKLKFSVAHSDQLTVLEAYNAWLQQRRQGTHCSLTFAAENFLSVHTLRTLADLKYQFLELLVSIGFVDIDLPPRQRGIDYILSITGPEININSKNYKLLQGLLCAALYPNIATIYQPYAQFDDLEDYLCSQRPRCQMTFVTKQDETVYIHPSSVNSNVTYFSSPYLVYHEKIKTTKVFISEISMISILSLILFSGYKLSITHDGHHNLLSLDSGWVQFPIKSHTLGLILQRLRKELTKLLEQKMQNPLLNILSHQQGKRIIDVIVQIITKE
ncbi:Putative ATP-dependent RNA helicase DHX57 [Ooceraea biroi]|uniref:Putative ATP-dependent RNA helicase DHX57 n=1 Tax=Ooceraea biroi TaxID=2015173 RepID=A0A026W8T5_OOCBI|nr:Putative ATP-dependent RNA helicase DHX57 [Ooceraea biroi]